MWCIADIITIVYCSHGSPSSRAHVSIINEVIIYSIPINSVQNSEKIAESCTPLQFLCARLPWRIGHSGGHPTTGAGTKHFRFSFKLAPSVCMVFLPHYDVFFETFQTFFTGRILPECTSTYPSPTRSSEERFLDEHTQATLACGAAVRLWPIGWETDNSH